MADTIITYQDLLTYFPALSVLGESTGNTMIKTASGMAEQFCNRKFMSDTLLERYIVAFPRIYLKRYPVSNIQSIKIVQSDSPALVNSCGYVTNFESEQTNLTTTYVDQTIEYQCNPANGIVEIRNNIRPYLPTTRQYGFYNFQGFAPFYQYEVAYTGGFETAPDMLKYGVAMLVESMYSRNRLDPSMQSEKIGDYSYTRTAETRFLNSRSPAAEQLYPFVRHGVNGY